MIGTMSGTKICQELNEILKCCPGTKSGSSGTKFPSLTISSKPLIKFGLLGLVTRQHFSRLFPTSYKVTPDCIAFGVFR